MARSMNSESVQSVIHSQDFPFHNANLVGLLGVLNQVIYL